MRRRTSLTGQVFALLSAVALAAGCAQSAPPGNRTSGGPEGEQRSPKTFTMAIRQEPALLTQELAGAGSPTGGQGHPVELAQNYLVIEDNKTGQFVAQLATEQISLENGTWRINPDGTMNTTWRLRPNIKWHDGAPFTASDLVFSIMVLKDPDVRAGSSAGGEALRLMDSYSAPDPHTLTIQWSRISVTANEANGIDPMPKHLLEDLYQSDKRNFDQSSRFRDEFVGLGAYRLVAWELGSHFEFEAFPDYFLGRPKMDRVVIRIVPDSNTAVANILAETVDLLPQRTLDLDATTEVQTRWRGTGNIVDIYPDGKGFTILEVQHRADFARPHGAVTMTQVRQGLYHAIDRQTLAHTLSHGLAPLADSWYAPNSELRSQLESFVPQFPHDRNRAQQLLEDAGWTLGTDGVRVHRQTGERLEIQITGDSAERERLALVVADDWRQVGAVGVPSTLPRALARDREAISTQPGVLISSGNYDFLIRNRLHTREMTSAENRWTGANRSGYSNPRVDGILDRLVVTVAPRERLDLHKELLRDQMGDVPLMPLYWSMHTWFAVAGVTGVRDGRLWNLHEWDKR